MRFVLLVYVIDVSVSFRSFCFCNQSVGVVCLTTLIEITATSFVPQVISVIAALLVAAELASASIEFRTGVEESVISTEEDSGSQSTVVGEGTITAMSSRPPIIAMCHGGGPMPMLGDPGHRALLEVWKQNRRDYFGFTFPASERGKYTLGNTQAPKGIIVLSAHDTSRSSGVPVVRIGVNPKPSMYYDYGFPDTGITYSVKYPARGPTPEVAAEVIGEMESKLAELLKAPHSSARPMKVEAVANSHFDHGVFIPMLFLMPVDESNHRDAALIESDNVRLPAAELPPVITVSSFGSQDPADHIQLGRMLSGLRDRGYMIVGSGTSSHVFAQVNPRDQGRKFNTALSKVLTNPDMPVADKEEFMLNFLDIEGANEAQRRGQADHFMPWLTCFGAAIDSGSQTAKEVANVLMMTWHEVSHAWV